MYFIVIIYVELILYFTCIFKIVSYHVLCVHYMQYDIVLPNKYLSLSYFAA